MMRNEDRELADFGRELDRGGNPPIARGGTLARPNDPPGHEHGHGHGNGNGHGHEHGHSGHGQGNGQGHGHHRPPPQGRSHASL
jgi:hypothetical protein